MPLFKQPKSLAELEEEREHEEAEVSVLKQRLLRKRLEEKMGKGGMRYFRDKNGVPVWTKVQKFLNSVGSSVSGKK